MSEASIFDRQHFGQRMGFGLRPGLLIVDFTAGFNDPASFGGGNISEAVRNTVPLLARARSLGLPIAHTRIVYADDASDTNVHCLKVPRLLSLTESNPDSHFVPELVPATGEIVIRKRLPSAFFGTDLAGMLLAKGVDTLIVAGCTTSGCVRASTLDAMCHGFRPIVVSDCVGDRAPGPHAASLFDLGKKYADVLTRAEVFDELEKIQGGRMSVSDDFRLDTWKEVLGLCKVREGESIVVLTGESSHPRNIDMAMRAALAMGAQAFRMDLPPRKPRGPAGGERTSFLGITPLTDNRLAIDTLKRADLILDLMGLLHSPEQLEILAGGTRMLMVIEPPEVLDQMVPVQEDKRRVMAANARLCAARAMRVTSKAGTDLSVRLGQFKPLPEYGFSDDAGHWDHWPSGFISTWPDEGSANGRVVIDEGDMLFPFKMYVSTPISLQIKDGFIQSIEGGFEAKYLRKHIESYRDPGAYGVSHLGWGLQPKAKWTGLGMRDKAQSLGMDARAFYGNFLFSTGPNSEAGGSNASPCHVDIPMSACSVSLDDEPITVDGEVVATDQRVSD